MTKPTAQTDAKVPVGSSPASIKYSKVPDKSTKKIVVNTKAGVVDKILIREAVKEETGEMFFKNILLNMILIFVLTLMTWMTIIIMTNPRRSCWGEKDLRVSADDVFLIKHADVKVNVGPPPPKSPQPSKSLQPIANETKVLVYDGKQKYMTWPDPPNKDDLPSVARYVMHISEFGSLATNSTHKGIEGYPFVNIFSVSDGPFDNATGVPYFYFTPLELSVIDMKASNKVSLTLTEAQSNYCNKNGYDPEDPRCAHVIFTGVMEKIEDSTEEHQFAKNALFSRHAEMPTWPAGHDWFFAKLKIQHIYLLDYFGGANVVDVDDYFGSNPFGNKKN